MLDAEQRAGGVFRLDQVDQQAPVAFIGSMAVQTDVTEAAASMRAALGFDIGERGPTFTEASRHLAEEAEEVGSSS